MDDNVLKEIQENCISIETVVAQETQFRNESYTSWPVNITKRLISLYQEYHLQQGVKFRKQKQLWEIISNILNKEFNLKLTPSQVENKWRTLLRSYKAVTDNNNKTGRGRKTFEFQNDMDIIFLKKKNVYPEVLLSEDITVNIPKSIIRENEIKDTKKRKIIPRNEILEKIRLDRQKQHEEHMKKMEERFKIEQEKLMERIRYNQIQEERNKILRQYLDMLIQSDT